MVKNKPKDDSIKKNLVLEYQDSNNLNHNDIDLQIPDGE